MKLLVLSCATGEGHNSAANALIEAIERKGYEYTLADPLDFRSKKAAKIAANTYNGIIKNAPAVFGAIYGVGALYSATKITSPIYLANAKYAGKLRAYIEDEGFDAVLCTHLFAMEALTALKKKTDYAVPSYGILTDYTCIPFLRETVLDGYFIPHEALRQELVEPRYMNAADVMISKPGGLSSTEAAVANIPLVHILAFSGCETKNAAFFSEHGTSVRAENAKEAVAAALSLLNDPDRAEAMRQAQRDNFPPDAADRIIESVTKHETA